MVTREKEKVPITTETEGIGGNRKIYMVICKRVIIIISIPLKNEKRKTTTGSSTFFHRKDSSTQSKSNFLFSRKVNNSLGIPFTRSILAHDETVPFVLKFNMHQYLLIIQNIGKKALAKNQIEKSIM